MKSFFHKSLIALAIAGLVSANIPVSAMATNTASIQEYRWDEHIEELLGGDYVEGEVVVGIDSSKKSLTFTRLFGGQELSDTGDEITTVSEDSLELSDNESANKDISIEIIRRDDMTTREIMEALRGDSAVVFAEPNYIAETSDIEPYAGQLTSALTDDSDRTGMQWGNVGGYGMNIPHWNENGGNMAHEVIVAVMDSGIDNQHADLREKMYHLSADEQAATGCSELRCDNINDEKLHAHGTHVAGIIGAAWNDYGISGVASKVKFIDVRNANSEGKVDVIASIKGYAQIKKLMEMGVKIQAINNSWSGAQGSLAMKAIVNEVGELGAVSLFAAGNDSQNLDLNFKLPSSTVYESPYVLVIGSSTENGKRSDFSNYSDTIVDVYAPGSNIMSTVPTGSAQEPFDSLAISNNYRNSFEDEADLTNISVQQELNGNLVPITPSLSDKKVKDGSHSVALKLNQGSYEYSAPLYRYYTMMSLGDISANVNGLGSKMLGFYLSTDQNYAMTTDSEMKNLGIMVKTTDGKMGTAAPIDCDETSPGSGIGYCNYNLPDNTDYTDFTMVMILSSQVESDYTFYMDALGIGDKTATVSYKYMSGTSMSTPGATGALAVLLGNATSTPTADVAKTMLLSRVRKISLTEFPSKTGGIIDLSINSTAYAPVITDTIAKDSQFILEGKNFVAGSKITLTKAGPYDDSNEINVTTNSVISSDQIIINFAGAAPKGLFYVTVTAPAERGGQSTKRMLYSSTSDKVYENTLSLVPDFEKSDDIASFNNNSLNGFAVEHDGYMYLMAGTSSGFVTKMTYLYRYDFAADSWQKMASIPADFYTAKGAAIDGKIFAFGTNGDVPKGYVYDIAGNNWEELDLSELGSMGVTALSLENHNGQLVITYAINNVQPGPSDKLYTYDYKSGAIKPFATLNVPVYGETAQTTKDGLYVMGYTDTNKTSMPVLQLVKPDGSVETLTDAFGKLAEDALFSNRIKAVVPQFAMDLAAVGDKLVLVGPANYAAGTDTFVLEDGQFVPYERRLSDALLSSIIALGHDGRIYAMAFAPMEENRVAFRSSQMVEPKEEPEEQEEPKESDTTKPVIPKAPNSGEGDDNNLGQNNNAAVITISLAIVAAVSLVYCAKRAYSQRARKNA
ncbi:S8 family serine peptidase [Candidatus Saccharibacteria bacterium]|nr:S8 family serine peptidase [Candidatus Saccharibacteria bacterium]